jgi:hypothetical protein
MMKLAVVVGLLLLVSFEAGACTVGCTPGYWKNHTNAWVTYTPTMKVTAVWANAGTGDMTLLQALDGGGGDTLEGARLILLRAAVAAILNEAKFGTNFVTNIKTTVATYLATYNRDIYISVASWLDSLNNTGCPL